MNKAAENRALRQIVRRSPGSIERKHGNISAVLVELNYVYLPGYKPIPHYQKLLKASVEANLAGQIQLDIAAEAFVEKPAPPATKGKLPEEVARPKLAAEGAGTKGRIPASRKNYLEIESRNRSLGQAGEELILKFEHKRLWEAGQRSLADRVEHVARTRGDGLGFDILSFEDSGKERLIEVKTTRLGPLTPFFATSNEIAVSLERENNYHLYRLFSFDKDPRFFVLPGALRKTCILKPVQFSAWPA